MGIPARRAFRVRRTGRNAHPTFSRFVEHGEFGVAAYRSWCATGSGSGDFLLCCALCPNVVWCRGELRMSLATSVTRKTNVELELLVAELQRRLADSNNRLSLFLSLTHQIFCCLECDPPVPTHLPAREQASMMLAARVADCNQAFAHLCGASTPAELIGSRFVSLVGTNSETMIERSLRFIRSGYCIDGVHNTETLHDGTVRHFVNTSRGEIQDGHVVRAWITGVDVTFRTLIEAASKKGDAELRRTAEQIDSAFWVLDWNRFEVLYVGSQIERRWGISCERLLEDPLCWLENVHDQDRHRVRDAFLTQAAAGKFDETFRVNLPDGSVGWVRNRCFALPHELEDELRVVGLAEDVSEWHRSQTGLRTLFDISTEMLFVMDALGKLQEVNPGMARILGYDSIELRGMSLLDLLPVEEHSEGRQMLSRLASGKAAVDVQSNFLRKDGTMCPVEWNAAPTSGDGLIYLAARDISSELTEHGRCRRQNEAASRLDRLSPRERQIAEMVVTGKASKVIARELDLSKRTVETHRANLMKKLKLQTTAELVRLMLHAAE